VNKMPEVDPGLNEDGRDVRRELTKTYGVSDTVV